MSPRSPQGSQELPSTPGRPPIGPRSSKSFSQRGGLRQQDSYSSVHGFTEGDIEVCPLVSLSSCLRICG